MEISSNARPSYRFVGTGTVRPSASLQPDERGPASPPQLAEEAGDPVLQFEQEERAVEAFRIGRRVARGVADTRGRTGVLLYVGVSERRAVVLADLGVRRAAPAEPWARATAAIDQAVARGEPASALPPLILALADLCSACLPRQDDDENELSDEVDS